MVGYGVDCWGLGRGDREYNGVSWGGTKAQTLTGRKADESQGGGGDFVVP